ncbi:hypothetical protein [Demequina litorisediminis]|uniref:hypothetical protein n=1 Tax=Demequina litorisediminis TaxID=1849022 RepID=UPI0024E16517|nr:hypothetical protein [Demequina litorisediminis]
MSSLTSGRCHGDQTASALTPPRPGHSGRRTPALADPLEPSDSATKARRGLTCG